MFVIDFDDTLFETQMLKKLRVEATGTVGVPATVYEETYKQARNSADGLFTYSNKIHTGVISNLGYDSDVVTRALEQTTKPEKLKSLLVSGAEDFLQYLRDHRQTMILLSLGDPDFQELKVVGSGIHKYFDRTFMVQDSKEHVMNELFDHIEDEDVWFINDKVEETKKLCDNFDKLIPILKVSPTIPIEEYKLSGMKYFFTFHEIKNYVSGIIK